MYAHFSGITDDIIERECDKTIAMSGCKLHTYQIFLCSFIFFAPRKNTLVIANCIIRRKKGVFKNCKL